MSGNRVLRSNSRALTKALKPQLIGKDLTSAATPVRKRKSNISPKQEQKDAELATPSQKLKLPSKKKLKVFSEPISSKASSGHVDDLQTEYTPLTFDIHTEPNMETTSEHIQGDSSLTGNPRGTVDASMFKTGTSQATRNLLEQAYDHLIKVDSRLKDLIDKYPCQIFSTESLTEKVDPFQNLCNGILSQQVSGPAAKSIRNKFVALFSAVSVGNHIPGVEIYPQPIEVAACEIPFLRQAGLSERKAEYIKGLAERFANGKLSADMLLKASDEEVMEMLIAVRGLGKWSVEMFALFALKRMDIFSTGDLGVQLVFFL